MLKQKGFSPVEVLLASTIFGFLVVALIGAIIYGTNSTAGAGDRVRAQLLAEEGAEVLRNIRDSDFANVTDGTYGLVQAGGVWTLSGTSDTTGIYTRQVIISSIDTKRKNVVVRVTWPEGSRTGQVAVTTRLTNWLAEIIPTINTGPTLMVYSKTTPEPFYRTWTGSDWSNEASALSVVGNINYVVVKSSTNRNEAILGVQTSTGAIYIQTWNGTTWGNLTQIGTGPTNTRSFDIAYEKASGRAMILYTPTLTSVDFAYRTWDGSTLSAATTVTTPPTTGAIRWMELEKNPTFGSNELAMMMVDANSDVFGMLWNGTTWGVVGGNTVVWDASAASAIKKTVAIEYEQLSGDALFIWGDSVATDQYYRTWNGTTLSAPTLLDIPAAGGVSEWVDLAGRPNSNEIMYGVQDAGADVNTRIWSGTAWDTATRHPEHSATVENIGSRAFDLAWETLPQNAGRAWIVWGDGTRVSTRGWTGSAWLNSSTVQRTDDTSFVRLHADPATNIIFGGLYEDLSSNSDDIQEFRLPAGATAWEPPNIIWGGPVSASPVYFRIDITSP